MKFKFQFKKWIIFNDNDDKSDKQSYQLALIKI